MEPFDPSDPGTWPADPLAPGDTLDTAPDESLNATAASIEQLRSAHEAVAESLRIILVARHQQNEHATLSRRWAVAELRAAEEYRKRLRELVELVRPGPGSPGPAGG